MANNDQDITVGIGTKADNSGIDSVNKSVDSMSDKFKDGMKKVSIATGLAGAALTVYSKNAVSSLQDTVKASKQLSTQTGLTVEESSKLVAVFTRAGITSDQTSSAFRKLSKEIVTNNNESADAAHSNAELQNKIDAAKISVTNLTAEQKNNGDSTGDIKNKIQALNLQIDDYQKKLTSTNNPLQQLGIKTEDASGKTLGFDNVLYQIADKFKSMPDGIQKTTDAVALFGKQGPALIKTLDKGADGIKELEAEATKLGLTLNSKNIKAIDDYTKSQKDLAASSGALKVQVGTLTAPVLTEFNNKINEITLTMINTHTPFHGLIVDTLAFGGPILGATSAVAGFASNIVGAWPAIAGFGAKIGVMADVSVASIVRVGTAMTSLDTLVSTPVIMPAIAVGAALISIDLVYQKGKQTLALLQSLNDQEAKDNASTTAGLQSIINSYKSGKISKATEVKLLNGLAANNAVGSNRFSGGWSWVGENGPELMNLPGGTQIKDNKSSQNVSNNTTNQRTVSIGNVMLGSASAAKEFFSQLDADNMRTGRGLSPSRGMS